LFSCKDQDWKRYEPSSLRGTLASVKRHLIRYSYGKTIFKLKTVILKNKRRVESETKGTQEAWTRKQTKTTTALTDDEIEILFDKKLLGLSSPQALLNTV